jgi:hypothetical protein
MDVAGAAPMLLGEMGQPAISYSLLRLDARTARVERDERFRGLEDPTEAHPANG